MKGKLPSYSILNYSNWIVIDGVVSNVGAENDG